MTAHRPPAGDLPVVTVRVVTARELPPMTQYPPPSGPPAGPPSGPPAGPPPGPPGPPAEPPLAAASSGRRWLLPTVAAGALIVGVAVGIGGTLAFNVSDGSSDADANARMACEALERWDATEVESAGIDGTHLGAAIGLAAAAAAVEDDEYEELSAAGLELVRAVQRLAVDDLEQITDDLAAQCAEHGLT